MSENHRDAPRRASGAQVYKTAELLLRLGFRVPAAELHEVALACDLIGTFGIPVRTLRWLDTRHHFEWGSDGSCRMIIDGHMLKKFVRIDVLLPESFAWRLDRHRTIFKPILLRGESSTLLFGEDGDGSRRFATLCERIARYALCAALGPTEGHDET
jgi:hypothetical protein